MRIPVFVEDLDVVEFEIEILVDGLEGAADQDVVFQFERDGRVGQGFEEGEEEHCRQARVGLGFDSKREAVGQVPKGNGCGVVSVWRSLEDGIGSPRCVFLRPDPVNTELAEWCARLLEFVEAL